MDKIARITLSIPGNRRSIAADGVLVDLARKLHGGELPAGIHEISIFADGSIVLDNIPHWEPTRINLPVHNKPADEDRLS